MDNSIAIALIAAGALIVGAVLSFVAAWLTARATAKLAAATELAKSRREARAFQRETLLAIQQELTKYARSVDKTWLQDRRAFREHGTVGVMGPEQDQESYDVRVGLSHLVERVVDDILRAALEEAIKVDMRLLAPADIRTLNEGFSAFAATLDKSRQMLGVMLRTYLQ
jgi:hypothetical protein